MSTEIDEEFCIVGHCIRTMNEAETNEATAQIPGLWSRVMAPGTFAAVGPRIGPEFYAVYTDYGNSGTGPYTLLVGVRVPENYAAPDDFTTRRVPSARYAIRTIDSALPTALVDAWRGVWAETVSGHLNRAFTTDVEIHRENKIELRIAVNP